ncbi:L,D-transpeptidase family protein [Flavobacterium sp. GA093]|uniref:L,D-transpeptidase family protein n=1 Tax=Flavobacterium hydrocarbonoxydans TaxID=2683249 RepID=A0A6I4NMC5_9FLAO|nr:L,D-transpeptidase family protein [Flavobacterium hydrocarbonoxydans]MWB95548.1 L,D-transpeptidase family protein [Flavobacterium hydrocarbonoxydans]
MQNFKLVIVILACCFFSPLTSSADSLESLTNKKAFVFFLTTIDAVEIANFFKKYPDLKSSQEEVSKLYKDRSYKSIWYEGANINEFAHLLYHKLTLTTEEGVAINLPYKEKIDEIFDEESPTKLSESDTELFLSSMYVIYAKKVYEGLDDKTVKSIEWFLPKKKISYESVLDSLMTNPALLDKNEKVLLDQYYKLEDVLKKYRKIEKDNSWTPIPYTEPFKELRPDDSSTTIAEIRKRLFIVGDLKNDNKSNFYDQELMDGVMKYKNRYNLKPNYIITLDHIKQMNEPIGYRIKTLLLNMERCRWVPPSLSKANEYVMVNIPSFMLYFVRDGKYDLVSNVFIGTPLTKTVIFSGNIDRIVFSPYWYLPTSIINNELKLKMAEDKNYLTDHNMEWNNGKVRQKPGPKNSLGLVKFMFPNPNDIYLHDSPAKSLFTFEKRIFSHGCINVMKAKELAVTMLKNYPDWPEEKITQAMSGEKETPLMLKKKVPIYIGYFTAWVNEDNEIRFFDDVYKRDPQLDKILFPDDPTFKIE